jgi:hypothetical protein
MQTLIKAAGSLESVEIIPEFDWAEVQDMVSTLLLSCNPNLLRKFCVASPISEAALLHAIQLPGLREFSIRGGTAAPADPLPLTIFPSLRTLVLSTGELPPWLEVLRHIQSKGLYDLSVHFRVGADLPTVSMHLQHSGIHKTLTRLSLCPGPGWILDSVSIAPLLVLGELIILCIYADCRAGGQCTFSLSDSDMERLVKAMPKLENLSLGDPCPSQIRDDFTVKSLLAIAKHCKALIVLKIHINCESIVMNPYEDDAHYPTGAPDTTALSDYHGCPLRSALFGSCPIPMGPEGGMTVAMTLLRLFPRLLQVRWHQPESSMPPWSTVNALVTSHGLVIHNLARFGESV